MNRRDSIKALMAGLAASSQWLNSSSLWAAENPALHQLRSANGNGKRLILIELSGANDGLNTLVPYRNDDYFRLRPTLALKAEKDRLQLSDQFALNAALQKMMPLWDAGELAWVQGLGYPKPNRSHFKSIALWESGGDGHRDRRSGWLTHDLEHGLGRKVVDAHGISLKGKIGLFNSSSGTWMSLRTTEQLEASTFNFPDYKGGYNGALDKVANQMQELHHAMSGLTTKLSKVQPLSSFRGALGPQLSQLLRLIYAGIDTPVYRIQLNGFDTHQNQLGRHARLLNQLASGIHTLRRELIKAGEWDNTLIMSYSEFGRRAAENLSAGTDHGTAAPHFVAGGSVQGGLYGVAPNLSQLVDGDPDFTMDYRALYQQVLGDWFDIPANQFQLYRSAALDSLFQSHG